MKIPEKFTTVTPLSKALALIIFVIFPFLGFVLGIKYVNLSQIKIAEIVEEKIISAKITPDCTVKVITTEKIVYLPTGIGETGQDTRCYQFGNIKISTSGKYLVFEDISGGIDAKLSAYYPIKNVHITLGVYGTSTIIDLLFLPDDRLVFLNGYPNTAGEQWLSVFDFTKIFKDYPKSVMEEFNYLRNDAAVLNIYTKNVELPKTNKTYRRVEFENNKLKLYDPSNNAFPATEFDIDKL